MIISLTIFLLFYLNILRFLELRDNTSLYTWKQYWLKKQGIVHSLNIILIGLIVYFISKFAI